MRKSGSKTAPDRTGRSPGRFAVAAVVAAVTVVLALTGCSAAKGSHKNGDTTLVIGQTQDVTDFNPYSLKIYSYNLNNQLYNVPVRYDQNLKPQPELASSWEQGADGKSLTLHLRDDVMFHNGDHMTSADIAFSIKYAANPDNAANIAPLAKQVVSVDTPDPKTAVLHYEKPNPAPFDLLDLLYISDHAHPDTVATDANGTGPFTMEKFQAGQQVTLASNKKYWRTPPALSKVEVKVLPDAQTSLVQLTSGSIDMIARLAPQDYSTLTGNAKVQTGLAAQGQSFISFDINTSVAPLSNPKVRQALSLALDRSRIASEVVGKGSVPGCLPYPKTSLAYDATQAASCKFDLAAAKDMLRQAGVSNLTLTIQTSSAESPALTQASQIFQADLKKIGVTAKVTDLDDTTYVKNRQSSDFQVEAHLYGRAGKDPSSLFGTANSWQPAKNAQKFKSAEYTKWVGVAGSSLDPATRKMAYLEVNKIILAQNFVLVAAQNQVPWAAAKGLKDFQFSGDGLLILEHAHW
ncbi:MAG: ABC transporter substrate-binding protein [Jatrophihabitans sp.]